MFVPLSTKCCPAPFPPTFGTWAHTAPGRRPSFRIQTWTTARVTTVFQLLQQLPNARPGVDVPGLARAMDSFFWSLLAQAVRMPRMELDRWIDSATHLIHHALFTHPP